MNATLTLLRREYWEHRGIFLILPLILFGLILLASLILGIAVGGGFTKMHPTGVAGAAGVAQLGLGIGGFFYSIYAIALIFYLSFALFSDRQDGSVLFWRALPVSDQTTVAAKLGAAALLGPAILWIFTIIAHLILLFALALAASARGAAGFSVFDSPVALFGTWGIFAYAMLVQALWWLPYFGWLLFVSAISRRFALLWAFLPPLVAGFAELIVLHTAHVFAFLGSHLGFSPVFPNGSVGSYLPESFSDGGHPITAGGAWVTHFFTLPSMWIGVGIGLVLLVLAVVARRYSATA